MLHKLSQPQLPDQACEIQGCQYAAHTGTRCLEHALLLHNAHKLRQDQHQPSTHAEASTARVIGDGTVIELSKRMALKSLLLWYRRIVHHSAWSCWSNYTRPQP